MVFGWGKKKVEPQTIETTHSKKEIKFSEINKVLDDIKTLRTKTLIVETKSIKNKISVELDDVLKIAKTLENDDLKVEDIDRHLKILVTRGKSQVISTINKEAKTKFTDINSYEDALQYDKEISYVLKKIGDALGRQTRVIHIFAKKYAGKLKDTLSTLVYRSKGFQTILENHRKLDEDITLISETILQVNQTKKGKEIQKERLVKTQKLLDSQGKKIESAENNIERLKTSYEHSEFLNIKNNIAKLDSEKSQIKNDIDLQFTKISRPLGKYSYISSLEKPQKLLMEKLIQNPINVLTKENKPNIVIILESTKKGVETGSISVKDAKKSAVQINEIINILDNFINKISEFNEKRSKLEDSLKVFDIKELNAKKSELSNAINDKNDLEKRIQSIENELLQSKKKIPNLILDIEKKLREVSSTQYTIVQ